MRQMPKFATPAAQAQVETLMQPALIRVIDNIRKQLEASNWQGSYEEELVWPSETTEAQKQEYLALQKQLHGVPPEEHDRVALLMSALPQPSPLYSLRLKKPNRADQLVDIWALCYQVCSASQSGQPGIDAGTFMEADRRLFDESGDVDWRELDDKTKALVEDIFSSLS